MEWGSAISCLLAVVVLCLAAWNLCARWRAGLAFRRLLFLDWQRLDDAHLWAWLRCVGVIGRRRRLDVEGQARMFHVYWDCSRSLSGQGDCRLEYGFELDPHALSVLRGKANRLHYRLALRGQGDGRDGMAYVLEPPQLGFRIP